jgi:uncharacterized protein DUF1553/uncharacterized protein DUF1549/Big-like domain-containing protein
MRNIGLATSLFLSTSISAFGADLQILPDKVLLTGAGASQRLIVVASQDGQIVADVSGQAKFSSSNADVAIVDAAGVVRAVNDGETVITATDGVARPSVKVRIVGTKSLATPSFRNDIIPMMTKIGCNSGACHGALAGKGGLKLSLRGYDPDADHFTLTRQGTGRRINLQEPNDSLVLLKPSRALPHGGGRKLPGGSEDYAKLHTWIAAGAPAGVRDPVLERIEVFPTAAVLKPQDSLQVVVRAWYADGHSADVTNWAKFGSTEELVAKVDDGGHVTVIGHGETAITVWFSNQVATVVVSSPLLATVNTQAVTAVARVNFIDELVLKKLQALHIPPSPLCTDNEFIRRAYLDAAGILPTPEEARSFVADHSPQKRAKLVQALLARPEFVDYWAYKWSDLLLVSSRRLPQQAVWAFHQYIRASVAENKPWNQFAKDILTASGSTLDNGAANYFVIHKDVAELTEATSVTFMGMSITCCRCHNHPLEKWTQDQYWSMANLFSRLSLKNGERGGDVIVQSQPFGDVLHLRKGVAMPPAPLDAKPLPLYSSMDRRQYFADWLTRPDNPYFARAIVNRVWRNFLGRGLVEPEDDMRATNPATNPELLDALAKAFVAHHYDLKQLIYTIMTSATYQRSSQALPENAADDRFYSHYLVRRLTAEVILDAYAQVTNVPTAFTQVAEGSSGGVKGVDLYPLGTRALQLPDALVVSHFLDTFGRPDRSAPCACERQQDASVTQALHLNNGETLNGKLRDKKSRINDWLRDNISDEEAINRLFLLCFSREPAQEEMARFKGIMAAAAKDPQTHRREVLEDLFWAVLTSREFLFNR